NHYAAVTVEKVGQCGEIHPGPDHTHQCPCCAMFKNVFANRISLSSPVCLFGSSENLITGVHSPSSGRACVIFITIFIRSSPTSLVKSVPIPKECPIFP